jgi:hypothetical protein
MSEIERQALDHAKTLPLLKSSFSPALDEVRWNFGGVIGAKAKLIVQYRCGGDGRSIIIPITTET